MEFDDVKNKSLKNDYKLKQKKQKKQMTKCRKFSFVSLNVSNDNNLFTNIRILKLLTKKNI